MQGNSGVVGSKFCSGWFIFSSRREELFVSSTAFNTSSNFRSNDDARGPIQLRDYQIIYVFQYRNQFIGSQRVAVGPVRLRRHVVNHVQPAALQRAQSFVEMSVFARPGIGEYQIELIRLCALQPIAAVRVNELDSKIIAETLFR